MGRTRRHAEVDEHGPEPKGREGGGLKILTHGHAYQERYTHAKRKRKRESGEDDVGQYKRCLSLCFSSLPPTRSRSESPPLQRRPFGPRARRSERERDAKKKGPPTTKAHRGGTEEGRWVELRDCTTKRRREIHAHRQSGDTRRHPLEHQCRASFGRRMNTHIHRETLKGTTAAKTKQKNCSERTWQKAKRGEHHRALTHAHAQGRINWSGRPAIGEGERRDRGGGAETKRATGGAQYVRKEERQAGGGVEWR